ncbi:hypothetical protein MishRS11D_25520 [Methylomagnum ishizawai]|nr:hypothetical protein MishRS11D_25520 [Methylomagnum ishizawai]
MRLLGRQAVRGGFLARGFDAGADAGEEWVLGRREGFHLLHINHLSLIRLMGMPGHAIQAYRFSGATLGPAIRLFSVSGEG